MAVTISEAPDAVPGDAQSIIRFDGTSMVQVAATLPLDTTARMRPDTWPPDLLAEFYDALEWWREKHPDRAVVAITFALVPGSDGRAAVMAAHVRARAA